MSNAVIARAQHMRRAQRLQRPEQFQRVRRGGTAWSHPLVILNAARNRASRTRCGFVVGKAFGKAHDRNRAKRRAREAVRRNYASIASGYDLVFVLRTPIATAPFDQIERSIIELLRRAGLWIAQPPPTEDGGTVDGTMDGPEADPLLPTLHLTSHAS